MNAAPRLTRSVV